MTRSTLRRWGLALLAAAVLGLVALAPGPTVSGVANSGSVWAGLLVLGGWLVRRPVQAAAAGVVVGLTALVVHDGVGQLLGLFDAGPWAGDRSWFVVAGVAGGPLGLLGAAGRRSDRWGLLARLAVPVGAVLEPLLLGSPASSGAVLVVAGAVGGVTVLRRASTIARRGPRRAAGPPRRRAVPPARGPRAAAARPPGGADRGVGQHVRARR